MMNKSFNKNLIFPQANDFNKIVSYVRSRVFSLNDPQFEKLNARQKSYYKDAAEYIGLLTDNEPTKETRKLFTLGIKQFNNQLVNLILKDEIFYNYYIYRDEDECVNLLSKKYSYSEVTLRRRISTVKAWINWCDETIVEKVVFPAVSTEIMYSQQMLNFFEKYNIKEIDVLFNVDFLRDEFKNNMSNFSLIKTELQLKGFNFELENPGFFAHSLDYNNYEYIYTEKEGVLEFLEIERLGLSNYLLLTSIDRRFLNYMSLERLQYLSKNSSKLKDILKDLEYEIIKNDNYQIAIKSKNELPEVGEEDESYGTSLPINKPRKRKTHLFVPKSAIIFLSQIRKLTLDVILILNNANIYKLKDVWSLKKAQMEELASKLYKKTNYKD